MKHSNNSHSQLSLFDDLDGEITQITNRIEAEVRAWMQEIVFCHFCGEQMTRAVMPFNHGIVFNGWCMKALAYHIRNGGKHHTEEARWLESKGIDPKCNRYDPMNFRQDLKEQHFDDHYSACYRVEDCK